jgi:hypothetical protein
VDKTLYTPSNGVLLAKSVTAAIGELDRRVKPLGINFSGLGASEKSGTISRVALALKLEDWFRGVAEEQEKGFVDEMDEMFKGMSEASRSSEVANSLRGHTRDYRRDRPGVEDSWVDIQNYAVFVEGNSSMNSRGEAYTVGGYRGYSFDLKGIYEGVVREGGGYQQKMVDEFVGHIQNEQGRMMTELNANEARRMRDIEAEAADLDKSSQQRARQEAEAAARAAEEAKEMVEREAEAREFWGSGVGSEIVQAVGEFFSSIGSGISSAVSYLGDAINSAVSYLFGVGEGSLIGDVGSVINSIGNYVFESGEGSLVEDVTGLFERTGNFLAGKGFVTNAELNALYDTLGDVNFWNLIESGDTYASGAKTIFAKSRKIRSIVDSLKSDNLPDPNNFEEQTDLYRDDMLLNNTKAMNAVQIAATLMYYENLYNRGVDRVDPPNQLYGNGLPFQEIGRKIVEVSQRKGVNPALMLAIYRKETSMGKNPSVGPDGEPVSNPFNVKTDGNRGYDIYDISFDDSLELAADTVSKWTSQAPEGQSKFAYMADKYAPPEDGNENWKEEVQKYYREHLDILLELNARL